MSKTNPTYTTLKQASCPTLSLSGLIDYEVTLDTKGQVYFALTGNSGTGYFSKARQPLSAILDALEDFASKYPLTSFALKDLYPDTSINSWGFLMAALLAEDLIQPLEDNKRHFRLCDPARFLQQVEELKAKHSDSRKGKAEAAA
jgi:hypothetical protein